MLYQDYEWEWEPPKREGLYLVWRGDVETLDNFRGCIRVRTRTDGLVYWTATDPAGNETIGTFDDMPDNRKYARVGE